MNEIQCGEYYLNTGKVPPLNILNWVSVYNIITSAGWNE